MYWLFVEFQLHYLYKRNATPSCILGLPNCFYYLRTGRVSLIRATGCQTSFTDCSQWYCIGGATCDASQETVVLESVTLCPSFGRLQHCYICLSTHPSRPADVCYRLCHLSQCQVVRATRSLKRGKKKCFLLFTCRTEIIKALLLRYYILKSEGMKACILFKQVLA